MSSALHDRAVWRVTDLEGNQSTLETFGAQTWAMRALIAAGAEGLLVEWGAGEKLRAHFADLGQAGVAIDASADAAGQRFTLRSAVERIPGQR